MGVNIGQAGEADGLGHVPSLNRTQIFLIFLINSHNQVNQVNLRPVVAKKSPIL